LGSDADQDKAKATLAAGFMPMPAVTEAEARAALAHVVGGASFRSAPQLSAFLTFVVERKLSGRAHEIKGYTIAVEALGRPADFDPVADPIVRVEAGRLRRALDAHYAGDGAADPVRIQIERGSYVPRFVRSDAEDAHKPQAMEEDPSAEAGSPSTADAPSPMVPSAPSRTRQTGRTLRWAVAAAAVVMLVLGAVWRFGPSVGVVPAPFAEQAESSAVRALPVIRVVALPSPDPLMDQVSRQFSENLTDALSRFDEFVILDALIPQSPGARQPTVTYKLEHRGQVAGTMVNAVMRLIHEPTGRVVWSTHLDQDISVLNQTRETREMARRVVVRLAQPYGVIHSDLRSNSAQGSTMACVVRTYDYWTEPSESRHLDVRACLESAVENDPLFHPAWALLAMVHLDEYRIGYNLRNGSALERARIAAHRAVLLAPESARALQALMAVLTVSGETEAAIRTGFDAVRRNPFDTDILADLGARLTQAGRAHEGRPLLVRAADLNMARPAWHDFYLFLSARTIGDTDSARSALRSIEGADAPLALLARAIAAVDAGELDKSLAAMRRLAAISPVFGRDAGVFLDRAYFAPEVRAVLLDALRRGGLASIREG
jgi:tetratricopeptide (TPR) repeat protein